MARPVADAGDAYPPRSWRERWVLLAVTVATVVGLWSLLLWQPGAAPRRWPWLNPPECTADQVAAAAAGCVGGRTDVQLLPPSARPASAAPR